MNLVQLLAPFRLRIADAIAERIREIEGRNATDEECKIRPEQVPSGILFRWKGTPIVLVSIWQEDGKTRVECKKVYTLPQPDIHILKGKKRGVDLPQHFPFKELGWA